MAAEQTAINDGDASRCAAWLARYQPAADVPDELFGRDGRPRQHWLTLLETLAALGETGVEQRFAAARRRINDIGVTYRVHGEARERPWPLSRLPLLLPESEWREISAGVIQRAELLERILKDVYGEGRLVAEGALPAAVVAGSPDYIRAMQGVAPAGGRWLGFYAADIGRGPDGKWRVLGDRAQAPSGAGYALENRLILARTLPSLYRDMNVRRLAPFFRDFRSGLAASAKRADPRICLMTAGPYSETYSEQVYLARYLGFLLVEGEDLVVDDNKLHVRTIAGLKRADVVWRRVDADWCDPLELNAASRLGVPGFLEAIRHGSVSVANMPGVGLIESRALLSFLPALAQRVLGEELKLANVATWWCGLPRERDEILMRLDERAVAAAFGGGTPGFAERGVRLCVDMNGEERARLAAAIAARGMDYVGQEMVKLSTTPSWVDGSLSPRPFVLRIFAAATQDGWRVMPGGFCRVSENSDVRAISMDSGVSSADVWVVGERPIEQTTLLPTPEGERIVRISGNLPSRAADNLFWVGRYLERAEATLRLVRALCLRLSDEQADPLVMKQMERLLVAWGAVSQDARRSAATVALAAATDVNAYGSALSIARQTKGAASIIRERLTLDTWQLLGRLEARLERAASRAASEPETLEYVERALHTLAALSGLMNENFNRVAGWSFLDLGKRIERAIATCRFSRQFTDGDATTESLDALLELIDSQITYRARYVGRISHAPTLDMAMLDPYNPRSVSFQLARIDEILSALPMLSNDGMMETPRRLALRLRADLDVEEARDFDTMRILSLEQNIMRLADMVSERYFIHASGGVPANKPSGLA